MAHCPPFAMRSRRTQARGKQIENRATETNRLAIENSADRPTQHTKRQGHVCKPVRVCEPTEGKQSGPRCCGVPPLATYQLNTLSKSFVRAANTSSTSTDISAIFSIVSSIIA
jgi:hypothetical protein